MVVGEAAILTLCEESGDGDEEGDAGLTGTTAGDGDSARNIEYIVYNARVRIGVPKELTSNLEVLIVVLLFAQELTFLRFELCFLK